MAVLGTQTTNHQLGGPYAQANPFAFTYPPKAIYPGGTGGEHSLVVEHGGTGGGVSIYSRTP